MVVLKSCCCFSNVRSGSIACGAYSLLLSLVSVGIMAYNMHLYSLMIMDDVDALAYIPLQMDSYSSLNNSYTAGMFHTNSTFLGMLDSGEQSQRPLVLMIFLSTLVVTSFLFCCSVVMIVGVCLDQRRLLLPWIMLMTINIFLDTGTMTYHTTHILSLSSFVIEMVIWLLLTALNVYCLLCVASQYLELGAGRGTREFIQRIRAQAVYSPSIQQVHINQGPIIIAGNTSQSVTSFIRATDMQLGTDTGQLMATLLVSAPPDYYTATSQVPQYYQDTQMNVPDPSSPLLPRTFVSMPNQPGSDSPPPPYTTHNNSPST